MGQANGVALSPEGKTLWATEYARNLLHRVNLESPTSVPLTGSKILYHFTGPAPDSMRVDADGNVYVALVGQGRVLIFNPAGSPIGQVLLPERDKGLNLRSTSLALHPEKTGNAYCSREYNRCRIERCKNFFRACICKGHLFASIAKNAIGLVVIKE